MTQDIVDAELVEEPGTDLAVPPPPTSLFKTDDPVEVVERASKVADALKGVLVKQGLTQDIQGKQYVRVEGWQTLGSMLGITSVCEWTKPVDGGWEARVTAQTMAGQVIGAADAQCLHSEKGKQKWEDYAIRSMAQTRATSKALRSVLAFVVTLAGYEATPAEEMPGGSQQPPAAPVAPLPAIPADRVASIMALADEADVGDKLDLALAHQGATSVDTLTAPQAAKVEKWLSKKLDAKTAGVTA